MASHSSSGWLLGQQDSPDFDWHIKNSLKVGLKIEKSERDVNKKQSTISD
jgi:hypothetical protein